MFIVCKYIAKNMLEKKFRTFIIIFSITISAALFFASIAISNTMSDMIVKQLRQYCGDSDIIIRPGSKSPTPFFSKAGLEKMQDRTIYSIGAIEGSARYISDNYNNTSINFISMNFDEIAKMNPIAPENRKIQILLLVIE